MGKHKCGCVYADERNTKAVRNKTELGGYLKEPCELHDMSKKEEVKVGQE